MGKSAKGFGGKGVLVILFAGICLVSNPSSLYDDGSGLLDSIQCVCIARHF